MVVTRRVSLQTQGDAHIIDITRAVTAEVEDSPIKSGIVVIFTSSSTSALTTIEYEPGAVSDLRDLFDRVAPADIVYRHNERWGDGNGHAHVRTALLGASLTVPERTPVRPSARNAWSWVPGNRLCSLISIAARDVGSWCKAKRSLAR